MSEALSSERVSEALSRSSEEIEEARTDSALSLGSECGSEEMSYGPRMSSSPTHQKPINMGL